MRLLAIVLPSLLPWAFCASAMAEAVVHHELVVKIEPQDNYLASQDRIRLPEPMAADECHLNRSMQHIR